MLPFLTGLIGVGTGQERALGRILLPDLRAQPGSGALSLCTYPDLRVPVAVEF